MKTVQVELTLDQLASLLKCGRRCALLDSETQSRLWQQWCEAQVPQEPERIDIGKAFY